MNPRQPTYYLSPSEAGAFLEELVLGPKDSHPVKADAGGAAAMTQQPASELTATVGTRWREERLRLGHRSNSAFARVLRVSQQSLSKIELGKSLPSGNLLAAVAVAGFNLNYVLIGERAPDYRTPEDVARLVQFRLGGEPLTLDRVGEAVVATLNLLAERRA